MTGTIEYYPGVDDDDLTLPEAAALLGRTHVRVWQYVRDGLLPARKVGRDYIVRRADVLAFKANMPRLGRPPKSPPKP